MRSTPTTVAEPEQGSIDLVQNLRELSDKLHATFKALSQEKVDESGLRRDFEALAAELTSLDAELKQRAEYFDDIAKKLRTKELREGYLKTLDSDAGLIKELAFLLAESWSRVKKISEVNESVYKLLSKRQLLARVEHAMTRKAIGQALTAVSVTIESVLEGRRNLEEILTDLEDSGLESKLDWKSVPAEELAARKSKLARPGGCPPPAPSPEKSREARREGPDAPDAPVRGSPRPGRREGPESKSGEAKPRPGRRIEAKPPPPSAGSPKPIAKDKDNGDDDERPADAKASSDSNAGASHPPPPREIDPSSGREIRRIRSTLEDIARRQPLIPSRISSAIGVIAVRKGKRVRGRLQALWAERRIVGDGAKPADDGVLRARLWDHPSRPPQAFLEATEAIPLQAGAASALVPAGASLVCETHYRLSVEDVDFATLELPPSLMAAGTGTAIGETFTALNGETIEADLERRFVDTIASRLDAAIARDVVKPFLDRGPQPAPALQGRDVERRLVRITAEFEEIPIKRFTLGFHDPALANQVFQFDAWFLGQEEQLLFGRLPQRWTGRAAAWFGAAALAGMPLGFGLIKLVQWAF
jgi:hypothetical protein